MRSIIGRVLEVDKLYRYVSYYETAVTFSKSMIQFTHIRKNDSFGFLLFEKN